MRCSTTAFVIALLAGAAPAAAEREVIAGPVDAHVIRVVDGDTIEVRAHIWLGLEMNTLVRIAKVNTPELQGRCAEETDRARVARDYLLERLTGGQERVLLRNVTHDKYGNRVVADVLVGEADIALEIIDRGLGEPYSGRGQRMDWCARARAQP